MLRSTLFARLRAEVVSCEVTSGGLGTLASAAPPAWTRHRSVRLDASARIPCIDEVAQVAARLFSIIV